ncbi:MAG: hypothetical protein C0623_01565 [Desulfuromonas sp.]|nr:MAG: hypothetical protein C0623_01565 [Desulfuromonas sp.]
MLEESRISLECPHCGDSIYQAMRWFRRDYRSCPHCDKPIPAGYFDATLNQLEQAFDQGVEEMMQPETGGCCGSKKGGCCGH